MEILLLLVLIYLCKPLGQVVGAVLEWSLVVAADVLRLLWLALCWSGAALAVVILGALLA